MIGSWFFSETPHKRIGGDFPPNSQEHALLVMKLRGGHSPVSRCIYLSFKPVNDIFGNLSFPFVYHSSEGVSEENS